MAKTKYTPFLKLKANEVAALSVLAPSVKDDVSPFFDLPRKEGMDEASFTIMVIKGAKKIADYWGTRPFYLDNFDIPDDVSVSGGPNYNFIAQNFKKTKIIPVIGLDRTAQHNQSIFLAKKSGLIEGDSVAIRLLEDDFQDFDLVEKDLQKLISAGSSHFSRWVLILDCRVCLNVSPAAHANMLASFIDKATAKFDFAEVVVTGSSLPASIADVAKAQQCSHLSRVELSIFKNLRAKLPDASIGLGDYTVVSPMYSELTLAPEMMRNVMAPKVVYSYDDVHYIARGGALKTHPRGDQQYNDIALEVVSKPFYRGNTYSWGDTFLDDKAKGLGAGVTPGSILKPTINAHITYMATGHSLVI